MRRALTLTLCLLAGCSKPTPPAPSAESSKSAAPASSSSPPAVKGPQTVASGLIYPPKRLVTDGKFLYWTSPGQQNASGHHDDGVVMKVSVDGGKVATLSTGLHNPEAIAVDDKSIYFTSRGTEGKYALNDDGAVLKLPKDGGAPITLASARKQPSEIVVREADVFFLDVGSWSPVKGMPYAHKSNPNGAVCRVSRDGGAVLTIAAGLTAPHALAADGTHVYWSTDGKEDAAIFSAPRAGGAAKSLVTLKPRASALAVDASGLLYAKAAEGGTELLRLPPAGGEPSKLGSIAGTLGALLQEEGSTYIGTTTGEVISISKGAAAPTTLASGQSEVRAVAVTATHVFWASGDKLLSVAK